MANAAKVGLLWVVFVVLFVSGYAFLGRSLFAPPNDIYYAEFEDATGITKGTAVQVAGIPIGTVAQMELVGPRRARVTLNIKQGTQLPVGTTAVISGSLIGIGNNPLTLEAPLGATGTLPAGTTLPGRKASALESMVPNGDKAVEELTKTITAFRKILEDPRFKNRTDALLSSSNQTIQRFGELADTTNKTLLANQQSIDRALTASSAALQDVHRVTTQIAILMERGKIQRDTEGIVANVRTITARTDRLIASIDRLVNDPELRGNADKIAAHVAEISKTGESIARNTDEITRRGVTISDNVAKITENGVGISANVKTISEKAITLTDQANELAKGAIDIENQLKGTLDKVGGFFNKGAGKNPLSGMTSQMDLIRETDPNRWRTDVTFMVPLSDSRLYFGIFDAFEANRLTVQFGKPVTSAFGYRYGLFASKPSIGVDLDLAKRLSVRGDLFDINDPRLDLRLRYEFGNGLIGWMGVNRLFDDNAPTIGIGVRR